MDDYNHSVRRERLIEFAIIQPAKIENLRALQHLKEGFNPVVGKLTVQIEVDSPLAKHDLITPSSGFKQVLEWAVDQYKHTPSKMDNQYVYIWGIKRIKHEKVSCWLLPGINQQTGDHRSRAGCTTIDG